MMPVSDPPLASYVPAANIGAGTVYRDGVKIVTTLYCLRCGWQSHEWQAEHFVCTNCEGKENAPL